MAERVPAHRVVVIGGGLAGLSAAHRVASLASSSRAPVEVVLLEAKDRLGGAIWTAHCNGFVLEGGADSFITNKPWGVDLCRELGLAGSLVGTDPNRRRSFVVRDGRLVAIPEGFVLMAPSRLGPILTTPLLSMRGKLRLLLDLVIPRKTDDADESLASFAKRRFGREAFERLIQPLVAGIYTADPNDLSVKATFPQYLAMERNYGGLIRGAKRTDQADKKASGARYGLFVTLADGMESLPNALAAALPAGSIHTSTPVRRISRPEPRDPWQVELLDGSLLDASVVIVASEAHASARLLDGLDADLAAQLRSIPYASSVVVNVAYPRDAIAHPLDGFGAIIPAIENRSILAISFTSVKFPGRAPAGSVLLRVFLGGALQPEFIDLDDLEIERLVRRELGELLGASGDPLLLEIGRHPRGMPQYTLGHGERVAEIDRLVAHHSGLFLAGAAFEGVGIPDTIRSGRKAAELAMDSLAEAERKAVA